MGMAIGWPVRIPGNCDTFPSTLGGHRRNQKQTNRNLIYRALKQAGIPFRGRSEPALPNWRMLAGMRDLLIAHSIAAGLHLAMAVVGMAIAYGNDTNLKADVYEAPVVWNATECRSAFGQSSMGICPDTCPADALAQVIGRVDMAGILLTSQCVTALGHITQLCMILLGNLTYMQLCEDGIKVVFWMEYAVTAPAIAYITSYYGGYIQVREQLLLVAAQGCAMFLGLCLDLSRYIAGKSAHPVSIMLRATSVVMFVFGFFAVSVIWVPPLYLLMRSDSQAPDWVFAVVLVEFLLYCSFGVVQLASFAPFLAMGKSPSGWQTRAESMAMIVLSFASKATLCGVFAACLVYGLCE